MEGDYALVRLATLALELAHHARIEGDYAV
jgi:hypothetical protein